MGVGWEEFVPSVASGRTWGHIDDSCGAHETAHHVIIMMMTGIVEITVKKMIPEQQHSRF